MQLVQDELANPNRARNHLSQDFGAHMNISFIYHSEDSLLIMWSYRSPQLC
jgi:hypothetical protein